MARASRLPSGIAREKGRRQGLGCEGPPAPGNLENCPSSLNWEATCSVVCLSSALGQDEYEAGACLFCPAGHFDAGHLLLLGRFFLVWGSPERGLRGRGKQKEDGWNFPGFSRPWLNSKNENVPKVPQSEASLLFGTCTLRKPGSW